MPLRVGAINAQFGLNITEQGLYWLYKKHHITKTKPQPLSCKAFRNVDRLDVKRAAAIEIASLLSSGKNVVYVDSASFNLWGHVGLRIWQPPSKGITRLLQPYPDSREQGRTVYGACGEHLTLGGVATVSARFHLTMFTAPQICLKTDTERFTEFLHVIKEGLSARSQAVLTHPR